ncbi:CRISPR-associated endonuclease Cas1 [Nocardia abscessus]|uniref:CRISPR-associated endonuclease Cas1 n=1 Tax=Nocardia abscessus TaxID=120957 RepID=UPI0024575725|nr:CRISPR-associated endonuclease Cas1 [Nocardia abscessus]
MRDLRSGVASVEQLDRAWNDILGRDAGPGRSEAIARFARDAERNLTELRAELLTGDYRPESLYQVLIPKPDGGFRELVVPSVRDRIVERALLSEIAPHIDPLLGAGSFAYRPGLGVADAVQAVVRLREEGFGWVLRADIKDCFATIPRARALRLVTAALPDASVNDLLGALTGRRMVTRSGLREVAGIPQGTSLSPMLSNLVLVALDNALLDRGFPIVRFADDFTVVCADADEAWEAARTADAALREMRMALSQDKTEVMSFAEGFSFLGEDFGPRYPPVIAEHRVREPTRRVLYLGLDGSRLFTGKGRLIVESRDDEQLLDVPISHVARIVCFGAVGMSAGVRSWALARDVEVVFLSRRGTFQGLLLPVSSPTRAARVRAQLRFADDAASRSRFARAVVDAKIRHQVTLLQRFGRREHADDLRRPLGQMRASASMLPMAATSAEVMGLEGAAARNYYDALAALLPAEFGFTGRTRRPPMDVVNAAFGYGYAVLLGECVSALVAAGLDPVFGLLHSEKDNRPSLALDLMEEFRPMVLDQVVLTAIRRESLTPIHGVHREGESGIWLTKAGKQVITEGYERRMLQMTGGALAGFSGSLRRHLYRQAERLAAHIDSPDTTTWTGLSWR